MPDHSPARIIYRRDRTTRLADQCDCACAETPVTMSALAEICLPLDQVYRLADQVRLTPLAGDWHMAFQPRSPFVPTVINTPARDLLDAFRSPRAAATLAPAETDAVRQLLFTQLIQPLDQIVPRIVPHTTTLTAWLHLTNACNLRCALCYLNKSNAAMTLETGQRAIDALIRSALHHAYASVKLKFAGGEPLLQGALIRQLHDYARRATAHAHLALDAVVLSNGTLLDDAIIEALQASGMRLMISLDGIGDAHNAHRRFANGAGSFAVVARGIARAVERGLVPDISITISDRNVDGLAQTLEYVLANDLPFTLNFYRENDCAAAFDLNLSDERVIRGMRQAFRVIETNLPRRSLLGGLLDRASFVAPHTHTCAVGRDYVVIDSRGRIAKCQMQIERTLADVSADDPLSIVRADATGIQNPSVDDKEVCRACEWKYFCAGGCPLATWRATARYDLPSPYCAIYKTLYPEVLRLEGLRLVSQEMGRV